MRTVLVRLIYCNKIYTKILPCAGGGFPGFSACNMAPNQYRPSEQHCWRGSTVEGGFGGLPRAGGMAGDTRVQLRCGLRRSTGTTSCLPPTSTRKPFFLLLKTRYRPTWSGCKGGMVPLRPLYTIYPEGGQELWKLLPEHRTSATVEGGGGPLTKICSSSSGIDPRVYSQTNCCTEN